MSVWYAVLKHSHSDALGKQPVCDILSFAIGRDLNISATRAYDYHLAIRFLREIEIHSRKIRNILEDSPLIYCFRARKFIGLRHFEAGTHDFLSIYGVDITLKGISIKKNCPGGFQPAHRLSSSKKRSENQNARQSNDKSFHMVIDH